MQEETRPKLMAAIAAMRKASATLEEIRPAYSNTDLIDDTLAALDDAINAATRQCWPLASGVLALLHDGGNPREA